MGVGGGPGIASFDASGSDLLRCFPISDPRRFTVQGLMLIV